MAQRYPFYPSQNENSPWPTQTKYSKINRGISMRSMQKYDYPLFTIQNKQQTQAEDTTIPTRNFDTEVNIHIESYAQQLQKTLCDQTCGNIESLIESNNLIIERLKRKNQILVQHLRNLRELFSNKSNTNSKLLTSQNQISSHQNQKPSVRSDHSQKSQIQILPIQKKRPKLHFLKHPEQQRTIGEQTQQKEQNPQCKRVYLPSKGPVHYTKQSWTDEQHHVQQFLNSWMKENLKPTPSDPFNTIEKRIILNLYMKWRQIRRFEKSELQNFKIQQIITNQMKVIFRCKCTMKDYVGIVFEKFEQKQRGQVVQKVKSIGNLRCEAQQREIPEIMGDLSQEQGNIEEEFSIGQLQGDLKIEENSYLYS